MKPLHIALLVVSIAANGAAAIAQSSQPPTPPAMGATGSMPMHHQMGMRPIDGMHGPGMIARGEGPRSAIPTEPGQAAFGAIQQIVWILQTDPRTDWSKVDVDALRQHLIDMDEVTMRASAQKEPIENGLRIKVTGSGPTLEAIQRMVPAHAREIDGMNGWTVRSTAIPDGAELTVIASEPADVRKIRALGFLGIMVQGGHHQMHHLAMAKGEPIHAH